MPITLDKEAAMAQLQQVFKAYTSEELAQLAKSLEVPRDYVIYVSLVPKNKERSPQVAGIVEKARSELAKRRAEGYTSEQAAENLTKIRNQIVEKYC